MLIKAFENSSTDTVSRRKMFNTKRKAVFLPIPGKDDNCSTASSMYFE
jgi:hypothetical protein